MPVLLSLPCVYSNVLGVLACLRKHASYLLQQKAWVASLPSCHYVAMAWISLTNVALTNHWSMLNHHLLLSGLQWLPVTVS